MISLVACDEYLSMTLTRKLIVCGVTKFVANSEISSVFILSLILTLVLVYSVLYLTDVSQAGLSVVDDSESPSTTQDQMLTHCPEISMST